MAPVSGYDRSMAIMCGATTLSVATPMMAKAYGCWCCSTSTRAGVPGDPGGRRLNSYDVIETLAEVMLVHGIPEHNRSNNGPEFVAKALRNWLAGVGAKTL